MGCFSVDGIMVTCHSPQSIPHGLEKVKKCINLLICNFSKIYLIHLNMFSNGQSDQYTIYRLLDSPPLTQWLNFRKKSLILDNTHH